MHNIVQSSLFQRIHIEIHASLSLPIACRSPNSSSTFNSYAGQLAVSVQDGNTQWIEDEYQRGQSSSVSPRGGYCSSASTPHSSGGSYGTGNNNNAYAPNMGTLSSASSSVFNSTSSEFFQLDFGLSYL